MDNVDNIGDDHPSARIYADPIGHHSILAPYYKYRAPYLPAFFAGISRKLGFSAESSLLDICCGRGELSVGYARHAGRIHAIDGSPAMLEHAMRREKISYALHDINETVYQAVEPIDHFVIGSAIHWIRADSLAGMIEANLRPGGSVVISHPLLSMQDQPYKVGLDQVLKDFGKVVSATDLYGLETLGKANFKVCDKLRITRKVKFDLKYLFLNQMSLAYGEFFQNVTANLDLFEKDLLESLRPFVVDGKLEGTVVNWAYIYRQTS